MNELYSLRGNMLIEQVGEDRFIPSKLKAYKNKAQCRVDFEKAYDELDKDDKERDRKLVEIYRFYVDMGPQRGTR